MNQENKFKIQFDVHDGFNPAVITPDLNVRLNIGKDRSSRKQFQIETLSPLGVDAIGELDGLHFDVSGTVYCSIDFGKQTVSLEGLIVAKDESNNRLHVRFVSKNTRGEAKEDRRIKMRWFCPKEFLPTAIAPNPAKFNDFLFFKVVDLSGGGIKLTTSARNKLIFPNQILSLTLSLPLVGSVLCSAIVRWIDTKALIQDGQILIGVELLDKDPILKKATAEYILNFSPGATLEALNKDGFQVKTISKWLDFGYVKTKDEYDAVIDLRYRTFKKAGKLKEKDEPKVMMDTFDSTSQILYVKHKGEVIGTARMIIPQAYDEVEISKYIEWPQTMPQIQNCIELSRMCTQEDARGADVMYELMQHACLSAVRQNRRYLFCNAGGHVPTIYSKIGWIQTGIVFGNKFSTDSYKVELLYLDIYDRVRGKGISGAVWRKVYQNLLMHLDNQGLVRLSFIDHIRVLLRRYF